MAICRLCSLQKVILKEELFKSFAETIIVNNLM